MFGSVSSHSQIMVMLDGQCVILVIFDSHALHNCKLITAPLAQRTRHNYFDSGT